MKIFVINGSGGSGKDAFVEMVADRIHWENSNCNGLTKTINVENISTIDPLRDAFHDYLGIDTDDKTSELRSFLSETKALWSKYFDGPVKAVEEFVDDIIEEFSTDTHEHIIFIHSREPQEIKRFSSLWCTCKSLLVDARGRVESITTNASDAGVFDYDYDIVIDNSGNEEELKEKVDIFLNTHCNKLIERLF